MRNAKHSDWKTTPLPKKRVEVSLDYQFTPEEKVRIVYGLVPESMEDRWFIVYKKPKLFFYRSWSGFCIYIVHFQDDGKIFRAKHAEINRDFSQYRRKNIEEDKELLKKLIDILLSREPGKYYGYLGNMSQCGWCVHWHAKVGQTCDAFPKGAPREILTNKHDHQKPFPGDNGIQFEPNPKTKQRYYPFASGNRRN